MIKALGLFGLAMGMLVAGRFVQLDDTTGFGSDEWVWPLGPLAFLAAVSGVVVAARDPLARRPLGAALGLLVVAVVALRETDEGFRFIWHGQESELSLFAILVVWVALALLATGGTGERAARTEHPLLERRSVRLVIYLGGTLIMLAMAFMIGVAHFEATECSGDGGGECDLAGVGGAVWAAAASTLCLLVAAAAEVTWTVRQRQGARG